MVIAYAVSYAVTYIATGSAKAAQGAGLAAGLFMGIGGLRLNKYLNAPVCAPFENLPPPTTEMVPPITASLGQRKLMILLQILVQIRVVVLYTKQVLVLRG
jgi:hypothetical protein